MARSYLASWRFAGQQICTQLTDHDSKGGWTLGNIDSESSFMTQIVNCDHFYQVIVGFSTYVLQ